MKHCVLNGEKPNFRPKAALNDSTILVLADEILVPKLNVLNRWTSITVIKKSSLYHEKVKVKKKY
jgi:hypothetical protein